MRLKDLKITYPHRCAQCFLRDEICICTDTSLFPNRIPVSFVMHYREAFKTTNTARLAHLGLQNCQIFLRGLKDQPLDLETVFPNPRQCLFLTLSEKSQVLSQEFLQDLTFSELVLPDGNWRQAKKMGDREPVLQQMTWVKLPPGPLSQYLLRKEPCAEGLATIEALAKALGIIEGPQVQEHLESLFHLMVERTLNTRPKNRQEENRKSR